MIAAALPLLSLLADVAAPLSSPRLESMSPHGGQRGTDVVLRLRGERLGSALDLVLVRPGLQVVAFAGQTEAQDRCEVTVRIAADCPLGAHPLRLRTAFGLSNLVQFHVAALPCVLEQRTGQEPQDVPLGCTVDGEMQADAVDRYRVAVTAGARVVCELESMRLGRATDFALAVVDAAGKELAGGDDSALGRKDPWVAFVAGADATVEVRVRAAVPTDRATGPYRLHVGTFPRPTGALPCGGPAGATIAVELLGEVPAGARAEVCLPDDGSEVFAWFPEVDGVTPPTPIWLRVGGPANADAPRDAQGQATLSVPGAVHGVVAAPGGATAFRFQATKGQAIEFRTIARALRSPLDPALTVRAADGRFLAGNDDSGSPDSGLRFDPPADGQYQVEVRDLLRAGSPSHFFRLEAGPRGARARVAMVVQRQEEPVLAVPQGGHAAAVLQLDNLEAAAELLARELPAGVQAQFGPRVPGTNQVPLLLGAADDAEPAQALLRFAVKAEPEPRAVDFVQAVTLVFGRNDFPQLQTTLRALPVAVTARAPFQVAATRPAVPIVRGAPLHIPLALTRGDGFAGRVRVRALWLPPGLGAGQAMFDEKATSATLSLDANGGAALGTFPVVLLATTRVRNAPLTLALPFLDVQVVEPMVGGEIGKARTEQGKATALAITLQPKVPIAAPYQATLLGLPRGVTAEAIEIAADATAATFALAVAADAAVGRHRSLQVELRVPGEGGVLLHRIGGGELRIDEPVARPAAPATAQGGGQ